MKTLSYDILKDKILGCWNGKNVGGVLGGPFEECERTVHDVTFYTQDIDGNPPANDDLDLQLVWLNAVEQYGSKVDAHILADYWMSYIVPNWDEYGAGKRNLRAGMAPPLSGTVSNPYKDSNGSFIRTELWACLAPGHPEIAVRYAYEDSIVDHADEGVYATVFCAAVQSAAFVTDDTYELIDIGLSYIPEDSLTAGAVKNAIASYKSGVDYLKARENLFKEYPSTFGLNCVNPNDLTDGLPNGKPGLETPNAIGIIVIGWLYGEGDFEKSLCIAVNCGEDTDCTAATLGAIFGIIKGNKALPEKWLAPLNGVINTCCIDLASTIPIPKSVEELSNRVIKAIPRFIESRYYSIESEGVSVTTAERLENPEDYDYMPHISAHKKSQRIPLRDLVSMSPYCVRYDLGTLGAMIDYNGEPFIQKGETKTIKLLLWDNNKFTIPGQWADVRIYTDSGITIEGGNYLSGPMNSTYLTKTEFSITFTAEEISLPKMNIIFDISLNGRQSGRPLKATFFAGHYNIV